MSRKRNQRKNTFNCNSILRYTFHHFINWIAIPVLNFRQVQDFKAYGSSNTLNYCLNTIHKLWSNSISRNHGDRKFAIGIFLQTTPMTSTCRQTSGLAKVGKKPSSGWTHQSRNCCHFRKMFATFFILTISAVLAFEGRSQISWRVSNAAARPWCFQLSWLTTYLVYFHSVPLMFFDVFLHIKINNWKTVKTRNPFNEKRSFFKKR